MATTKTPKKLSASLLHEAEEALKNGTPRPSGVSWNPTRIPQFMHADDAESMGEGAPEVEESTIEVQGQSGS